MKMHKLTLLLALLAAALAISSSDAAGGGGAIRTQLTRADAGRGLTRRQLLRRMALRSKARAARLLSLSGSSSSSPSASASAVPGKDQPLDTEYLISFAIGTPPQPVQVTLDTGSDLVWTQCQPCPSCYAQALPYYDPDLSATSAELTCDSPPCQQLDLSSCGTHKWGNRTCVYTYYYGDKSVTNGRLDADTFTFDGCDAAVPGLAFGCGLFNNGLFSSNATGGGIAGFGRGALSLPSQLRVDNFSYCFTNVTGSTPSPVLLGLPANLYSDASGAAVQTTPLIQSSVIPTFYYLLMKGITVGSTKLPLPESAFALKGNGSGGTIIDSGTSVTLLPPLVYGLLHDAFVSQVNLPVTNDEPLCFAVPSSRKKQQKVPKLELQFEGAMLDLPRENYVFEIEEGGQSNMCIAVMSSGGDMTIIGNYQQQNLHVLYDLAGNKLSFVPARCDRV
ncbi:hypothetical protein SEVIR_9G428700v4 [Setaria viridis]|uniref:Peptidase A1 domain-containing protein n=1 Tax=Setaria viridis TaxID=4556 RepID=A0A4U6T894_SETVI|nr:aspartic proteinase nepenthesin-1-like [Setaria viridis]TKV96442.1 hypothetical protein SEVIR_9G428700v2 [Setaria viridis]